MADVGIARPNANPPPEHQLSIVSSVPMDAVTLAQSKTVASAPTTESNALIRDCSPRSTSTRPRLGHTGSWNDYRPDALSANCAGLSSATSGVCARGIPSTVSIFIPLYGISGLCVNDSKRESYERATDIACGERRKLAETRAKRGAHRAAEGVR